MSFLGPKGMGLRSRLPPSGRAVTGMAVGKREALYTVYVEVHCPWHLECLNWGTAVFLVLAAIWTPGGSLSAFLVMAMYLYCLKLRQNALPCGFNPVMLVINQSTGRNSGPYSVLPFRR